MNYGLTAAVSRSLDVTETEADVIIGEQVEIGLDMLSNDRLDIEDVEELMYDMGIDPDYMDEFLMRFC